MGRRAHSKEGRAREVTFAVDPAEQDHASRNRGLRRKGDKKEEGVQRAQDTLAEQQQANSSKFVSEGILAGADNTDRPPQKLCVFDKGYRPPVHSFQAVRDLDQWSDPKDRLWPKVAIDDLQANCYLMVQRHSHGEPVSVVVPLFVYSTQLFEREVWAVWVPITTDTGRWEECGEAPLRGFLAERQPPLQEDAAQFTLTDQAEALVKAVLGSTARSLLRPDDTGTCTIDTSGLTLKEVTPIKREGLAGAAPADPRAPDLWRGLRLYAGPRVRLRSDESDLLGGSLCSEKSDTTVGSSTLVLAHFTRESVRTEPARSLSPLADRVLWLPPPCVFLPEEPEGAEDQSNGQAGEKLWRLIHPTAGTVGLTKGQPPPMPPSGASRLVWDTTGRDRGRRTSGWSCTSSPTSPAAQEMEFFANFLPPGLLEYIYAHRSEEKLLRRYEDGSTHPDAKLLFRVCKDPATCKGHTAKASELAKSCLEMRNQQEFTAKHAEDLFSLLKPGEAEADEWRERVRQLVLVKTGYEIPAGGGDAAAVPAAQLQAEDQKRLTPLNIAHCLDLQEVEYHPVGPGDGAAKQFTVAFSGRPFAVYCHERGRCLPLFRMATFYPDQPYWHLNCAVRHLQQQNLRCTLTVKENHGAKSKAVRPHSWIKGTYIVREPTEVGQGLRLLDQVMWDKDPLRVMRDPIQWLLGSGWRDTFAAPERWCWYVPSERDARPLGGDGCAAADPSQRKPVTERDTRPRWIFRRARDGRDRQEWSFPAAPAPWIGRAAASAVAAAVATASTGTGDVPQAQGTPSTPETQALPGTCGGQAAGDQGAQDPYDFFTYRLNLGTWMLKAARPLIWHINQALSSMRPVAGRYRCAPEPETLFYRGLKDTTLPAEVYAKGKVLLWGQFSSSSRDQGIALTFAKGRNASIFTLQGSSCRLIAPWSRFAREEEWLYGLNTLWYLENLLSEQQQQIISQSMQLYEMEEVTQAKVHVIQVRSALMHANAASSAAMVFGCLEALDNGGILNLALRSPDDGQTDGIWSFRTEVEYDAGGQCPVKTSRLWAECGSCGDAQALCRALPVAADGAQGARFAAQNDGASDAADSTLLRAAGGQKPVMYAARLFNITLSTKGCTPDTVSLVRARLAAPPSSQRPSHHQGQMAEVRVESRRRRWAFRAELRHQPGRHGNAVRDEGAGLLAKILRGGVPIKHVDLRNNQITAQGARALLAALRHNEHVASMVLERVSTLSALQEGERAESDVGSEAPGDGAPGDDQREVPKTSLEHLTVEELQHVINIRCLHNQGLLSAESVMGLGENWHTYAARALADCAQLQFDWGLIFDECAHDRTRLLEVTDFVRGLRPQGKAGSAASGGPKLPGALVAAARAGCRQMVKELLDAGADTREADSHGETALVKMRRRLANAAHYHHQLQPRHRIQRTEAWRKEWDDELRAQQRLLPLRYYYGKLLRRALAVLQQLEPTGRPPVLAEPRRPHDALWCAKEFALSAMRIWHARVESMRSDGHWCQVMKGVTRNGDQLAGSYIVFELLQHLFHWGLLANPTQHCPNCGSRHWYGEPEEMCERCIGSRLSCRYPLQNIRKHGSKLIAVPRAAPHSTLALEPVSRVGVTLLCYDYFLRNRRWMPPNGDSPEEIAQRLCPSDGKQGERCEEQSLQESPRAADPLASGAAESVQTELLSTANGMLYAERCREQRAVGAEGQLGPWIMLWAMAGCVPSLCPKDKVTLTTCMPCTSTVFEHILGLSRGDDFVIPGPSRWIRGQQGKRSGVEEDAAAEALCPSDVAYRVTLRVSGRLAFEEVGPLLAHGSAGDAADMVMRQVLLPALSMFVVDSVRSSDGARGAGGGAEGSGAKSGGGAQPSASGEGRCHVVMDLFSRGSLLDGDPELRSWRQEVLQQAEAAEALLEIGVAERSLHSGSPRGGGATQSHPEVKLYKLIRQACTSTEREDQELAAAKERQQGRREQLRRSEAKGADAEAALSAALAAVSAAVTAAAAAFGSIPAWRRDWGLMRELCRRAALLPRKDDPPADSTETLDGLQRMLRKDWLLFASHAAVRDTRLQRADRHKELAGLLRRSSVFVAHYPVRGAKQQTRSPQVQTWSPQVWVETEKGVRPFPYMMRPACTLLNLLGRSKPELGKQKGTEIEGEYMEWAHSSARHSAINPHMVLSCEFNEPLHSLGPQHGQRHRVTLNAAAIDNYVRECEEAGERDQVWDAITNCAAPPKAVDIYGTENFSVSIAEVQQLVNSTQVCTSGKLPLLFYLDIVRRFGTDRLFSCGPAKEEDEAVSRFFSPTRATPLNWLAAAEEDEEDPGKVNCLKIIEELRTKAAKKVEECRDNLKKQKRDGKDAGRYWSQQRNLLCYNFQSDVLGDTEFINRARSQLAEWRAMVLDKPAWWGFDSSATAEHMFTLSLTSLATTVCLSQKGYFLAAGDAEVHNQLCERTESQVVFICSSGIDFNSQMTRDMEKVKYFVTRTQAKGEDSPLSSQTVGQETVTRLEGFRPGGQESLLHRITELYDCIFRSARAQNVRNMSMLPLGLGEFLKKMKDDSWNLYAEVVRTYYRAQFLLLQREDWHFDNYFLSCPSDQRCFAAQTLTECVLHSRSEGGPVFSTNIVLHDRDSKSVALNLARRGMAPAFLVPCDPQALIHGTLGMDWEVGRGNCYGGEQDWGATSTGALGCFNVSGGAIGLDDVVLLEQDRTYLHVSRLWRGSASARTTATGMQNNTLEADPLSRSEAGPHGGERDPDIRSDRHSTVEAPTEVQLVCTRTVRADRAGLNVRPVAQATFGPFTGFEWSDSDRREIAFVKPRSRPRAREAKPGAGEAPQERRAQVAGQRAALDDPPEPERKVFRLADLSRPLYESLKRRLSELCHEHPQAMGQQHPQGEYDCRTSMQRHTSIPSPRAGARRISSAFSVESVIRSAMRPVQLAASHNDVYSPEIG
eukprot:TRINITY_DN2731_c0_g2_i1.p1 TRINITY_DN2731_c0_g2~~TRINITY_DN2731_c0_g2_i1.p1  ORF type:complete len:3132 (+),score=814.06 TRINITY_DN2731_c0_g2_i1:607-9396(+)